MNDKIWKQRAEDLKDVRLSIDQLLSTIRRATRDEVENLVSHRELISSCHKILAIHMQTLERYTRPIPIVSPFGIPLEAYKEQLGRYQELGLPFYLITELHKDNDDEG